MKQALKNILMLSFTWIVSSTFAQTNVLNAKVPSQIGVKTEAQQAADNDVPLPYGYVDDRDIMWSTTTWELIDLQERANFPLLFPIDTMDISADRRSLYDVLLRAMKENRLTETYVDSYFTEKRTYDDLKYSLSKADTLDAGYGILNEGNPLPPEYIVRTDLTSRDIVQYRLKGLWYFDKRQGELKYRLLGIAPVAPDVSVLGTDDAQSSLVELFWVWYPAARNILHNAKVFNQLNSANRISFDHLLNARRFVGVIYKEDNVYGDREIKKYLPDNALYQLLEADRIKQRIRDREQDMWVY